LVVATVSLAFLLLMGFIIMIIIIIKMS
jgi:hypothetical protein